MRLFFLAISAVFLFVSPPVYADGLSYAQIMPTPIHDTFLMKAETAPRDSYEVRAPRDGIIAEVYAWPGYEAGQGGILARLDDSDLKRRKDQIFEQKNELMRHLERVEDLMEQGHLSSSVWEKNIDKLNKLTAEMAVIEEKMYNSYIRSSARGTILWSELKPGMKVRGAEPLFWIGDAEDIWLTAKIDEGLITGLEKEDKVLIVSKSTANGDAVYQQPLQGEVDFVGAKGPKGDAVNIYIKAPRQKIEAFQQYSVLIPVPTQQQMMVIPENALVDGKYVWTLSAPDGGEDSGLFRAYRAEIKSHEVQHGVVIFDPLINRSVISGGYVLLDPPARIRNEQVLEAAPKSADEWVTFYTESMLGNTVNVAASGGSCGGGSGGSSCSATSACGAAGGIEIAANDMNMSLAIEEDVVEAPVNFCRISQAVFDAASNPNTFEIDISPAASEDAGSSPTLFPMTTSQ